MPRKRKKSILLVLRGGTHQLRGILGIKAIGMDE